MVVETLNQDGSAYATCMHCGETKATNELVALINESSLQQPPAAARHSASDPVGSGGVAAPAIATSAQAIGAHLHLARGAVP